MTTTVGMWFVQGKRKIRQKQRHQNTEQTELTSRCRVKRFSVQSCKTAGRTAGQSCSDESRHMRPPKIWILDSFVSFFFSCFKKFVFMRNVTQWGFFWTFVLLWEQESSCWQEGPSYRWRKQGDISHDLINTPSNHHFFLSLSLSLTHTHSHTHTHTYTVYTVYIYTQTICNLAKRKAF